MEQDPWGPCCLLLDMIREGWLMSVLVASKRWLAVVV